MLSTENSSKVSLKVHGSWMTSKGACNTHPCIDNGEVMDGNKWSSSWSDEPSNPLCIGGTRDSINETFFQSMQKKKVMEYCMIWICHFGKLKWYKRGDIVLYNDCNGFMYPFSKKF